MLTTANKGEGGVWQMLTLADEGGSGGLDPPTFGSHNLGTASYGIIYLAYFGIQTFLIPFGICGGQN